MPYTSLLQTWRWFGPGDPVSLQDIHQAGAEGIVTALHHIPHGNVWPVEEIKKRCDLLQANNFKWDVVESLTVHEDIKTRSGQYKKYIDQYKQSLINLAACGIETVTYNFMPITDWTRTDISYTMPDGSKALYFNWYDVAVFDIFILKRENAADFYSTEIVQKAEELFNNYSNQKIESLTGTVLFGIPGEAKLSVDAVREELKKYDGIDHTALKNNLAYFLQEVAPVASEHNIRLAIHPDDPPFDILGLPRVASVAKDFEDILSFTDAPANGICFCTGSLGANAKNDLPEIAANIGKRIHFVHLRNVKKDETGNFFEADHLAGDTDMFAVMKEILSVQQQTTYRIPFRPDHGHQMLDDLDKTTNPGYSAIGRLRGLAELRGLQEGILRSGIL